MIQLLLEAIRHPSGMEREVWIRRTCRGDVELELELRRLLAAHECAGAFLDPGSDQPVDRAAS